MLYGINKMLDYYIPEKFVISVQRKFGIDERIKEKMNVHT